MSSYKLTYFDQRGRRETARMLFRLAGQKYDEIQIKQEDWGKYKTNMLLNQLPFLEVDGVGISQSNAINRFLAKKFGLSGKDLLEQAQADMVVDTVVDSGNGVQEVMMAKTDQEKADAAKAYFDKLVQIFTKVESLLVRNGGGDGYFVGQNITWADVVLLNSIDLCNRFIGQEDLWSTFPKLNGVKQKVESHPKLKEYISSRPETMF